MSRAGRIIAAIMAAVVIVVSAVCAGPVVGDNPDCVEAAGRPVSIST